MKWTKATEDRILWKLKKLQRNTELIVADSGYYNLTKNTWLQGGLIIAS